MLPSIHKGDAASSIMGFAKGLFSSKQDMAAHGLEQADMDCLEESLSRSNSMSKEQRPSFASDSYGEDFRFSGGSPRSTGGAERLSRFSTSRHAPPGANLRPIAPDALPTPHPNGHPTILVISPNLPPKMQRPNGQAWKMADYNIISKMYTGYASTVYKAMCKSSGETVCLKSYDMASLNELNRYQILREIRLHSFVNHANIISLFGAFHEQGRVVMVQEMADSGDLFQLFNRTGGKMAEKQAVELVIYPMLVVLNYLHQQGICHRDIKPENILLAKNMAIKLCDFGLAIDLREERAVTRAGTLEYMAPEVLNCPFKNHPLENKENGSLQYSLTVDSWAMGILAYELLVGFPPFSDKQRAKIDDKIRYDVPRFPSNITKEAQQFILAALRKDPIDRPTIMELIGSSWIRAYKKTAPVMARPQSQLRMVQGGEEGPEMSSPSRHFGVGVHAQSPVGEMRTNDGDLMKKPISSFNSFSMGQTSHVKMVQDITAKIGATSLSPIESSMGRFVPPQATSKFQQQIAPSGGSFSSSVNPMLWRKK